MSTVIHNGFRWNVANWSEALAAVLAFQATAAQLAQDLLDNYLSRHEDRLAGWQSWMDRRDAMRRTRESDPRVDTDFSLTLFPAAGLSVPGVLGVVFTAHPSWVDAWLSQPGVAEYAYCDNADRPGGISSQEWRARRRNWKKALPESCSVPALRGFTIDLVPAHGPFPPASST